MLKKISPQVAKWKLKSSTFKTATYNQSLGTKGVTATQHTTTKQVILAFQISNSFISMNCAEIFSTASSMLPLQNVP